MEAERASKAGKILVAVSSSPNSEVLVRWARRTASALGWEWMALHVDPGAALTGEDARRLEANLALAREYGAETLVFEAPDIASAVVETAREKKATMIVLGRSGLSRLGFLPRRPTVSDRIVREADPIDVAIVQDAEAPRDGKEDGPMRSLLALPRREYFLLIVSFLAVTGLGFLLRSVIGYRSIALVYLAAVLGLSFFVRPVFVAILAVLSALVLNFFFMAPHYTFLIATTDDLFLFVIYFLVAFVTSSLVARLRVKGKALEEREKRDAFLLSSTRRLSECASIQEAAAAASSIVGDFCGTEALFLTPGEGGLEATGGGRGGGEIDADGMRAAARAFAERKVCGAGTGIIPEARVRCVPAAVGESSAGVIALVLPKGRPWSVSDDNLMLSLGRTFAFIAERERAEEMRRGAALAFESERLSKILLDSVSHELRTPLTTITGSISALKDDRLAENPESRRILVEGSLEASDRLNGIVEDILSTSRIESGSLSLSKTIVDIADLANEAMAKAGPELDPGRVGLVLPAAAFPVSLDAGLASRLAANLLRNAARYSPPSGRIEFSLTEEGDDLRIRVEDRGPGVPEEELETIFEGFKRGKRANGGGLGLGLAICKGIAVAHGGAMRAANLPGGGFLVEAVFPSCVERLPG